MNANQAINAKTALHDLWVERGIIGADSWHEREVGTGDKRSILIVPKKWSDNACNIFYSKYIRKAGVPQINLFDPDEIWTPCEGHPDLDLPIQYGAEWSVHHTIHRLAGAWTYQAYLTHSEHLETHGMSLDEMYESLCRSLIEQMWAPNSPQWFNTGLWWAYNITTTTRMHKARVETHENEAGETFEEFVTDLVDAYKHPQVSACFIQSVEDNLIGDSGIMDLISNEATMFKYGSGTGSNFSTLRSEGEPLTGGGQSSGLMSWLKIADTSAGAIKSGGTTRRAAKMVCLDVDHPDIRAFINWKRLEEEKVMALNLGAQRSNEYLKDLHGRWFEKTPTKEDVATEERAAQDAAIPASAANRVMVQAQKGLPFEPMKMDYDWQGEAYRTVAGQNANNSVRLTDGFMLRATGKSVFTDFYLIKRTDGSDAGAINASDLLDEIAFNGWACADPGVQFTTTINDWHTCTADGAINASNPCSEYMFLDDTACNLASINLVNALWSETDEPDVLKEKIDKFQTLCRLITLVLDISISMSAYPTEKIAKKSVMYRTIGLGYSNLGALLMRLGLPYDSDEGRGLAAAITSLMTSASYYVSSKIAEDLGPFPRFNENAVSMRKVMQKHRAASVAMTRDAQGFEGMIWKRANKMWDRVSQASSFRNAQTTVLAPTGTIAFIMDCDTTGIEPDYALMKFKSLAGGGSMQYTNQSLTIALKRLGYGDNAIPHILDQLAIQGTMDVDEEHEAVFHCANEISAKGHVDMMAVTQPFLSGAISKTINMPHDATIEDVRDLTIYSWERGLKAVAIYRDNSKFSQPLSKASLTPVDPLLTGEVVEEVAEVVADENVVAANERTPTSPVRRRLPDSCRSMRHGVVINGHKLFIHTGEYEDGKLGEIFINMRREGGSLGAILDAFAMSVSIALQYGVPLEEFVDALAFSKSEPAGMVRGHHAIKSCTSITDFLARLLGYHYLNRQDLVHIKDEPLDFQGDLSHEDEAKLLNALTNLQEQVNAQAPATVIKMVKTGDVCPSCHTFTMIRTGTCTTCLTCGNTSGCS